MNNDDEEEYGSGSKYTDMYKNDSLIDIDMENLKKKGIRFLVVVGIIIIVISASYVF